MIAKEKKPHNIGKTLIKPKAVGLVLEKTCSKKMANILLSDYAIKTPIDELAKKLSVKFSKN